MKFSDFLTRELPRAEYMPNPEGFISALAWAEYDVEREGARSERIRYRKLQDEGPTTLIESEPKRDSFSALQSALARNGLVGARSGTDEARAVLNSVLGMHVRNAKSQPASPLTPSLALMQNAASTLSKKGPPNFALILETLFSYGASTKSDDRSVSSLWKRAASLQLQQSPLLRVIDEAFRDSKVSILGARRDTSTSAKTLGNEYFREGMKLFESSPMGWFHQNWLRITSSEWVEALPPRVWVDWASAVIRTGVGFSYLWEATLYQRLADMAINDEPDRIKALGNDSLSLIDWAHSSEGVHSRDVASALKWRVHNGQYLRDEINSFSKEHGLLEADPLEAMHFLSGDAEFVRKLYDLRQNTKETGQGKARWEVVSYSLSARETTSDFADHYGFLRRVGESRFTIVDPATEWTVCTASLACGSPSSSSKLRTYLMELGQLGLEPGVPEMVTRLERAGVARGADDADLGLQIKAAF